MAVERRRTGRLHTLGPQRQRRTAAAELVGSRGMRRSRRGRRSAEPLQAKSGPAPDQPRREAASGLRRHCRQRTALAIGASSARSAPAGASTFRHHGDLAPTQRHQPRPMRHRSCRARCWRRIGAIGAREPPYSRLRSHRAGTSKSESKDAISASGALNRPRLSSGGTTASTASSFSEGSMRR